MHKLREVCGLTAGAEPGADPIVEQRAPPHDLDAEAAVLSAIMVMGATSEAERAAHPRAFDDLVMVMGLLQPEHFFSEAHHRIYEACVALTGLGGAADVVVVASWLRDHDRLAQIGGMSYLTQVLNGAPAVANISAYAQIIYDKWRVRQLLVACHRIVAQCYGGYGRAQPLLDEAAENIGMIAAAHRPVHRPQSTDLWNDMSHALGDAVAMMECDHDHEVQRDCPFSAARCIVDGVRARMNAALLRCGIAMKGPLPDPSSS